ncbi:MAG: hypothetical protein ACKO04_03790 [Actinomycetes bacterium]
MTDRLRPDDPALTARLWEPAAWWAGITAVVMWVQQVAYRADYQGLTRWTDWLPGQYLPFQGRVAWDAGLYLRVAERGYRVEEGLEAGFPAYALAIRWTSPIFGDAPGTGVALTLLSSLAAALLLWVWAGQHGLGLRARRTTLLLLLLYPWAFVLYGVVYSDAMLLMLVLGAAVLVSSERWVLAGLVAGLATATRPTALVLVPFLVVAALESSGAVHVPTTTPAGGGVRARAVAGWTTLRGIRWRSGRLRPAHAGVLLSLWGVLAYMVFLQRHVGNPFYFWTVQDADYGHGGILDPRTWLKASMLRKPLLEIQSVGDALNELGATAVLLGVVASAAAVGRRFGRAYTVLMVLLSVNVWAFCRWVAPGGRYLLPVVPFVAAWLAPRLDGRPALRNGLLVLSGLLMVVLAAGFAGLFDLHW